MSDLTKIGMILALISGIISVVLGILEILGETIEILSFGTIHLGGSLEGGIVQLIMGVLLIFLYLGRIQIDDVLVLGIVIIVLGFLGGGDLAIVGGILILLDYFLVSSGTTRTYRTTRT